MVVMAGSPFDGLAEKYDSWYETKGRIAFETELAALRPLLPGLPKPWLEIGVGTGRFAQELGIYWGVDPSARLLEKARSRGVKTYLARGEQLPFEDACFGTAFLLTTWAFLNDPLAVLREAGRVLKPEGRLVNGYLDRDGAWGASYMRKGREEHPLFSSARFASYAEVTAVTTQAGFEVVETVSTLFQGPGEVVSTEKPKQDFCRKAGFVVVVARKAQASSHPAP